ncbi:MAG: hypothetical protein MZU97_06155, partial [Bacillus subtilis]|nr:hypothetical protein [Bacillus subtilis]
ACSRACSLSFLYSAGISSVSRGNISSQQGFFRQKLVISASKISVPLPAMLVAIVTGYHSAPARRDNMSFFFMVFGV